MNKKIEVYDNGGSTADRFTVIIGDDVYTMSSNPLSPQGVCLFAGTTHELPHAREGVQVQNVPEEVRKAIAERSVEATYTVVLNVVTCGNCGECFAHKPKVEELTCPYCRFHDDISLFPDMWYENGLDSIIKIIR